MDKLKKVFLTKAIAVLILLISSGVGVAQMLVPSEGRTISKEDPYCGEGGYVASVLGIEDGCEQITIGGSDDIPDNVSDWVLIELRAIDNDSVDAATQETVVARKPAFLLSSGYAVDAELYIGKNCATFDASDSDNCPLVQFAFDDDDIVLGKDLFAVVRHLNHLDVISNNALATTDTAPGRYIYDFTEGEARGGSLAVNKVEITGEVEMKNAMYVGDANGDTNINAADYLKIDADKMDGTVAESDVDFDGMVNDADFMNNRLRQNLGRTSQLP